MYTFQNASGSTVDKVNMASHTVNMNAKAGDFYLGAAFRWVGRGRMGLHNEGFDSLNSRGECDCGVLIPKDLSEVKLFGSVTRSSRHPVSLFTCLRPNGSGANLTLTRVGTTTIRVTSTGVPLSTDNTSTQPHGEGGQLLFVGVLRAGTTATSANTDFSYTLVGS